MDYSVVMPCAGIGKRMGLGYNKLLFKLNDQTVLENTINIFIQDPKCKQIVLVISKEDEESIQPMIHSDKIITTYGGKERQDSVYNGLIKVNQDHVLIHDGARPYLKQTSIDALLQKLEECDACLLMVKAKDTMKRVIDGKVIETLNRDEMWNARTPQAFKTSLVVQAHQKAKEENYLGTDDASLVEKYSEQSVYVVEGDYNNIKITTIEDLK